MSHSSRRATAPALYQFSCYSVEYIIPDFGIPELNLYIHGEGETGRHAVGKLGDRVESGS